MSDRYEDERGIIQDLFGGQPIDSVTHITTVKDAVRGNHFHKLTTQWTYVLTGRLLMANDNQQREVGPFQAVRHDPGDPHAWRALVDTECLVFTRGPRSGENYESDTYRLEHPLL
jgi:quercetin dioxygenase-like cupin family protein